MDRATVECQFWYIDMRNPTDLAPRRIARSWAAGSGQLHIAQVRLELELS